MHVCRPCGSPLVHLVEGSETAPGRWTVTLRCPECEHVRDVRCDELALARLEEELCRGTAAILDEVERLEQVAVEEDAERFIAALHAGAILPMDFGILP
jgi:hypothetical protein